MIHVRSSFKSGTLAAATASFTVPSGKAINYSKAPNPVVQTSYFGNLSCIRNAVINRMDVFGDGSTTDTVYMAYRAGGGVGTAYEKSNANNFGDDTDYFTIDFSYPY